MLVRGTERQDQLDRADVVFSGVVVAPTGLDGPDPGSGPIDLTFRVERTYKGTVEAEPVVHANVHSASCGLDPPIAGRYLMFATDESRWSRRRRPLRRHPAASRRRSAGAGPRNVRPAAGAPPPSRSSESGDAAAAPTPDDGPEAPSNRLIAGTVVAVSVVVVAGL